MTDHRQHAAATLRNRGPILDVLRRILPASGLVLEIASGSGEHVVHFAANLPGLVFQPSDPDAEALRSITAWSGGARNIRPPLLLNAAAATWPVSEADAILCINMVHIAPWSATEGLLRHAATLLPPGAPLFLYGPYRRAGIPWADSNAAFDASLQARNPAWGVRHLETVADLAAASGFDPPAIADMPANNIGVTFRRAGRQS